MILTEPANDFVRDFVGSGASLKRLNLSRVRDLELTTSLPTGTKDEGVPELRRRLNESEWTSLLVLDDEGRPTRWLRPGDMSSGGDLGHDTGLPVKALVEPQATLHDALDEMLVGSVGVAVVVDGHGRYEGILDIDDVMAAIREMREADSQYYRLLKSDHMQGA